MKDLQQIIDDAPEGATHVTDDGSGVDVLTYLQHKNGSWYEMHADGEWILADENNLYYYEDIHSLADIKQILELQEQVSNFKSVTTELSAEGAWLVDRHNELIKDPAKFVDAESFFNAMQLIKNN